MSYFSEDELRCQCGCGVYKFDEGMLKVINLIREKVGQPLPISSGYRCLKHPIEAGKIGSVAPIKRYGAHTTGRAVDIAVRGKVALQVIQEAQKPYASIQRIGINQKGNKRFIHLDNADEIGYPSPAIWSY